MVRLPAENCQGAHCVEWAAAGAWRVWVQAEASRAQFVLLGEDQGLAEIETVTGALWRVLVPLGFRYLAIEEGPGLAALQDHYVRSGDSLALAAYRSAVLQASPPSSVEHIALLEQLRQATPPQKTSVVWGLDQERRAVPLLSRLVTLAPNAAARTVANAALLQAQQREAAGHYLLDGYTDQINALRQAFSPRLSKETSWFLALMAQSNRIYDHNNAPAAERRGYVANEEREDMIKDAFLESYRAADAPASGSPVYCCGSVAGTGCEGIAPRGYRASEISRPSLRERRAAASSTSS